MKKFSYIVRVITVAPLMALLMLIILHTNPQFFGNTIIFILAVVFLVIFPLLGYPFQRIIKKYKDSGRDGQRTLAFIFAVAGYIFGCLLALFIPTPSNVLIIYLSYLLSGAFAMILNKLFHFKASGHACGITGPFLLLVYFGLPIGCIGIPVLALSWLSSIYMKRHTHLQLFVGALIPFAALVLITIGFIISG